MKQTDKYLKLGKVVSCLFIILILICSTLPVYAYSHSPVVKSDTTDYYRSYGDPDISASLRGDPEFKRGENVTLQLVLSNGGTIEKLVTNESTSNTDQKINSKKVEVSEDEFEYMVKANTVKPYIKSMMYATSLSEKAREEMALEASRPDAKSLKIHLVSNDPNIKIPEGKDVVFLDELKGGYFDLITFPVEIGDDISSGDHSFDLVIDYDFSDNVLMYNSIEDDLVSTSFIKDNVFVREYVSESKTIPISFKIKPTPRFEITDFTREIHFGLNEVDVTYTNVGDATAYDSVAKISPMNPLTSNTTKIHLGDLKPGESKTVTYQISVANSAVEKVYVTSSDVRYYDESGDLQISSLLKLPLDHVEVHRLLTFKNITYALFILVILYGVYTFVKKNNGKNKQDQTDKK